MYKGDKWEHYDCIEKSVKLFLSRHTEQGMMYHDMFCYDELVSVGLIAFEKCVEEYVPYSTCSFKSYLMRGLKLAYLNEWKKRTRLHADNSCYDEVCDTVVDSINVEKSIVASVAVKEKEDQLLKAFKFIREDYINVWVAYYYDDLNMRDIAKIHGTSYQRVGQILDFVSAKLVHMLEKNKKFAY